MRPLRTLFYGMTHEHAPGKLETLKRLKDVFEVVAIVDDRPRRAPQHMNEEFRPDGIPVVSEQEAWRIPDVEVGFVETANRDLLEVAGEFAARGIPMHCDKPCGEALEPYRALVETCRAKRLPFQIGYMYRGNPALRFLWEKVRAGLLGEVAFVEADMNHDYQLANYPDYISTFRGGILYNLACHLVDMAEPFVTGEPTRVETVLGDAPGDPAGARTRGTALLSFGTADVLLRTSSHLPGGILRRRLRVDGSNGTADLCPIERFDGGELKLSLTLKEPACGLSAGEHEIGFGVQADRYAPQLLDLAAIVRGEKPNDQDYDRDVRVHALTLRMCGIE